jgi:hypothetical protein
MEGNQKPRERMRHSRIPLSKQLETYTGFVQGNADRSYLIAENY